jgi:hypothetical protein
MNTSNQGNLSVTGATNTGSLNVATDTYISGTLSNVGNIFLGSNLVCNKLMLGRDTQDFNSYYGFDLCAQDNGSPARFYRNAANGSNAVYFEGCKGSYYGMAGIGINAYWIGTTCIFHNPLKSAWGLHHNAHQNSDIFEFSYCQPNYAGKKQNFMTFSNIGSYLPNETVLTNYNVGVGINNTAIAYNLHLGVDSAAKPSSSTWTVPSDERLKTNISVADYDMCFSNVKSLDLKKYTYDSNVFPYESIGDYSKLGWIAQDVQPIFPKAINVIPEQYGLSMS